MDTRLRILALSLTPIGLSIAGFISTIVCMRIVLRFDGFSQMGLYLFLLAFLIWGGSYIFAFFISKTSINLAKVSAILYAWPTIVMGNFLAFSSIPIALIFGYIGSKHGSSYWKRKAIKSIQG